MRNGKEAPGYIKLWTAKVGLISRNVTKRCWVTDHKACEICLLMGITFVHFPSIMFAAANECAFLGRRQIALFLCIHSTFSLPFFWPNCLFTTRLSLDPSFQSAHSFHASASSRLSSNYTLGLIYPTVIDQYVSLNK